MTRTRTILHAAAGALLLMEAGYFLWIALAAGLAFVKASFGLPTFVLLDGGIAALLAILALGYWRHHRVAVGTLWVLWPLLVLYGAWAFSNGYRIMAGWSGVWEGDLVALGRRAAPALSCWESWCWRSAWRRAGPGDPDAHS